MSTPTQSNAASRTHFLDAARAIMLLLGIPFHASEVYRISGGFMIQSPDTSFIATLITALIHSFRMPAFFILSGYFGAMILARRGAIPWLRERIVKLGVPLVATTLTLGVLEQAIVISFRSEIPFQASLSAAMDGPIRYWINHRWFLVVLILCCMTLAIGHRLLPWLKIADEWISRDHKRKVWLQAALIGMLAIIPFAAIFAGKVAGEWFIHAPALKQYANSYTMYVIFFLTGTALMCINNGLQRFIAISRTDISIFIFSIIFYCVTYYAFYDKNFYENSVLKGLNILIYAITGFYVSKIFFFLMEKIFSKENRYVRYCVDASFCIYLVHEIFLLTAAGHFLSVGWPPLIEIALICAFTVGGSILAFEIARRNSALALVLNGGPFKKSTSRA